MTRARLVAIVVAVTALTLSACGSSDDNVVAPRTTTTTEARTSTSVPAPSTTSTAARNPAGSIGLRVYLVEDDHLAPAIRYVAATKAVATAALTELLTGPAAGDEMTSAVPDGTRLLGVFVADGVATVDLSGEFGSGGGSLSMLLRVGQVVYTATQFPTVQRVAFRIDGTPVSEIGGEGLVLSAYDTRRDFEDVLPAIFVDSPAAREAVTSPLRVQGTADVFEAQFTLEIRDGSGRVVLTRPVMTTSGTGTRGSFDVTVALPRGLGGPGDVVVFDASAKDGSRTLVEDVPVTFAGS